MKKSGCIAIFTACPTEKEAERIAGELIKKKLIACANMIRGARSIFRWKGHIERTGETLLIMKSLKKNFSRIDRAIRDLHSYEVPEIVSFSIDEVSSDYLKWIKESVR
ncbi:MAG: divalent-cation tolerance protein CutA [Candidatus Omnitrophica bacterium]|nr:divalent-cation tolerance protein CutA [Candidatus Omnitrophota bacterium]MBU4488948.1 divalent-cation tolerance protein CutA [Candidatus Omnitrophota bacterium]MCG2705244.1 divalent-cation tolerance protein CutA [Candidatus Omnitrophota bacterium]